MKSFEIISPVDGKPIAERSFASANEIEQGLDTASKLWKDWRSTPLAERSEICRKAVAHMLDHVDEISRELSLQMGRPIRYSPFEIRNGFRERAHYMIDIAEKALQDIQIETSDSFYRSIRKESLGTVLVLAPWNYPYLTSVNVIIPALLAGNCVMLKHALQTALCAERYHQAFAAAGLPEGVFQFLHLTHEQVSELIADRRIAHVAFTGSVAGGHAVNRAASARFINTGLELGGKDAAWVCADANFEHAVENLVDGAFFNSGQSCCGIERIYVDKSIFSKFTEAFVDLSRQYILGNPMEPETTLGPMVKPEAASFAQSQIDQACKMGASCLIDPSDFAAHNLNRGYMAPQVLVNVNHNMRVMSEESFAPLVGIMSVENETQALRLINDSHYGLTASVWTSDADRFHILVPEIEAGTIFMNRCDYLDPALAWTGVKDSGKGCSLSVLGFDQLTRPKSVHMRRL